jgi:flagellar biosynthesis regulator FlaF
VISKGSAKIEKDIAQKIALTYKNRVLSEVNVILDNFASYEARVLEHWINVMEVLMAAGFDDDAVLNTSKKQLRSRIDLQSIEDLSPMELDTLEKELRAALESLSLHKGHLSNIKISTQK